MTAFVGRQREIASLARFAGSRADGPSLGVVFGRRRVGKSALLDRAVRRSGGIMHQALRGTPEQALRDLARTIADRTGGPRPALDDWPSAVDALFDLAGDGPLLCVLDEYPYLLEASPELDSVLQRAFDRTPEALRLVVCGSALGAMRRLLDGTAPLRGRASLELDLRAFDPLTARTLHGATDPALAFRLHAIVGGVAAYARSMVGNDMPDDLADLDRWVLDHPFNPASPLFREAEVLLGQDPTTSAARRPNAHHAVLAAVASGAHSHRRLTRDLGMSGQAIAPLVETLVSTGFLSRTEDPLRSNRPTYRPGDPLLRFHYALQRPRRAELLRHDADPAGTWRHVRDRFHSLVLGPAFEEMARWWAGSAAADALLDDVADHIGSTTLTVDGVRREIDVVAASDERPDGRPALEPSQRRVLAIGEAKHAERFSRRHLDGLDAARFAAGDRAAAARLLLFGTAFTDDLVAAAEERDDVTLVSLGDMYAKA